MSRISGKINLLNLNGVVKVMKSKSGMIECLIIPIEENKLFKGKTGIYLDIIAFEYNDQKEGSKDTHLVKQSFSKEVRAAMTEDELKSQPILGNLQVWGESPEQAPVSSPESIGPEDDLPF